MSCCGSRRQQFFSETEQEVDRATQDLPRQSPATNPTHIYFEYTGRTALTVEGPISRRRYRFAAPGAHLAVDGRDAPSMAAVPLLKRVKTPIGADLE